MVNDATAHPLVRLERAKTLRKTSRASMRTLKVQSVRAHAGGVATSGSPRTADAMLAEEEARERQLSSQIRTLERSASQLAIVQTKVGAEADEASGGKVDCSPAAGTLELVALLKRKVAMRGSGDDDGHTLTSIESAEASIRLFKADREAMDNLVAAVSTRRDALSGDAAPIAMACKAASEFVMTAALRRILIDVHSAPLVADRISAAMCGVFYQKTHGNFSDEAKVTGLLPLVKRIDPEKRLVLAHVCTLIFSCGIHRESIDDMVDAWGPIMLSLSTKNAKLATACVFRLSSFVFRLSSFVFRRI